MARPQHRRRHPDRPHNRCNGCDPRSARRSGRVVHGQLKHSARRPPNQPRSPARGTAPTRGRACGDRRLRNRRRRKKADQSHRRIPKRRSGQCQPELLGPRQHAPVDRSVSGHRSASRAGPDLRFLGCLHTRCATRLPTLTSCGRQAMWEALLSRSQQIQRRWRRGCYRRPTGPR